MRNLFFTMIAFVCFPCMMSADIDYQKELSAIESRVNSLNAEIEGSTGELNKEIIYANLNFLESYITRAIKGCEKKLERYKSREVRNSYYSDDFFNNNKYIIKRTLKKIKSIENKSRMLKEFLFGIQVLRLRIEI